MMSSSEQVRGTMSLLTQRAFFIAQKLHTCSAQGAPFIVHAAKADARVATQVPRHDERRTLRVR